MEYQEIWMKFEIMKSKMGVEELLDAIIEKIPSPKGDINKPLRGLIFDSAFDSYRGVVVQTRIVDGKLKVGDKIKFKST